METKSISRLLSLLELGGQTTFVRIYPTDEASSAFWYAELFLREGKLHYGAVFSGSGERRYVSEQALSFLKQMGGLSYELLPFPARPQFPPPEVVTPPPAHSWRPTRTHRGERVIQNTQRLSRDERRVLSLIDGQRTVNELARLLRLSPEALSNLLTTFREQNFIS
ncbi:MAG TPA: hypothetical protein VKT82_07680 [Ktedonobacterales bacterium]|nr:hypothetical protein [Ktedonobacterales bacterium]